jgi:6-pyruvoyltetrahydropterin/6-carboxytetrahydropterin synthase
MYSITKEMTFEAAHRLFGYNGPCGNLHGHSYKVQVTVCSEALDGQGFVMDFGDLKKVLKPLLDSWDHATILQDSDPLVGVLKTLETKVVVFSEIPTAEVMARHIFIFLGSAGIPVAQVTVYETANNCASVC